MIGQTIDHYRVVAEIGDGGMGVIYRAEDVRLGRQVALKFLPEELARIPGVLERFQREARLASVLNHPNICTIHDIGEHAGRGFIVMELLEGSGLDALLAGEALPLEQIIDIGMQVTEGLEVAHRRGIVHRDITPSNIFITRAGQAKILDFGVAKVLHDARTTPDVRASDVTGSASPEELTDPGLQIGTQAYMSPEQARGESVDPRADLFSLGAVLYEMATGHRAFPERNPALLADAILNRTPVPPRSLNSRAPAQLEGIIEKAMEKDRALRYQDAADLLADLRRLRRNVSAEAGMSGSASAISLPGVRHVGQAPSDTTDTWQRLKRRPFAILAVLALLVGAVALGIVMLRARPGTPLSERDTILLGQFTNQTGEAVFDDTLRQALATQLAQSPFLSLQPDERVRETLRLMDRPPDTALEHAIAREVCLRQGLKAMLDGSIARVGSLYLLSLQATNCQTGETLVREQAQVEGQEQVLRAIGDLASRVRRRLGESLASVQRFDVPIEQATTPSLEALRAYTLGLAQRARGTEVESIPFFQRAIELDPEFASALTMLSTAYGNIGETAKAEEFAREAYARREHVSERERLLITFQYHDRVTGDEQQALSTLELWKQAFPRDYSPANSLALMFNRFGQYERAVEEAREAQRRNPSHPFPYSNMAYAYRGLNRYDEAMAVAQQAVTLGIETLPTRRLMYQIAVIQGHEAAAREHRDWARQNTREFDFVGADAQMAAYSGRVDRARQLFRATAEMAARGGFEDVAAGYMSQAAWLELLVGRPEDAARLARQVLAETPSETPTVRAAVALALAGDVAAAEAVAHELDRTRPEATFTRGVFLPLTEGAIEIGRGHYDEAVEHLRAARPYELGTIAGLAPIYFRAMALMRAERYEDAAREYQRILEHRGVEPFALFHPLARLGLARAAAARGQIEGARTSYGEFFSGWAGADEHLDVLRQAREEFRRLE